MNSIYKRTALIFASSSVLVLAGCGGGGGDSAPATATAPATPTLTDSAQARAFFAELRTTLSSFVNTDKTGFVQQEFQRIADDFKVNMAPSVGAVADQVSTLDRAINAFEDAKAGVGFSAGRNPLTGTLTMERVYGNQWSAIYGYGSYEICWTDSASGAAVSSVTCMHTGAHSADLGNGRVRPVAYTITSNGAGSYQYVASQYTQWASSGTELTVGLYVPETGTPGGSGTITKTDSPDSIGQLTINGTLPPSNSSTGVVNIALAATRTDMGSDAYQYAVNGTLSTASNSDASQVVSLIVKPGSKFAVLDSVYYDNALLYASILATEQTNSTRFDGILSANQISANYIGSISTPTKISFNGVITDLTTSSVVLNGTLTASLGSYSPFSDNAEDWDGNYVHAGVTFAGTIQAPSRPALSLSLALTTTGETSASVALEYGYGSTVIKGAGVYDSADPSHNSLSLNNQDGITVDFNLAAQTANVTKAGNSVATIKNGAITYVDGVTESLK